MMNPQNAELLSIINRLPSVAWKERLKLPETSAVYFALAEHGEVFYIGRTINLRQQWISHHYVKHLDQLDCARIAWLSCTEESASLLEQMMIQYFHPPLNGPGDGRPHPYPATLLPARPQRDWSAFDDEDPVRITSSEVARRLGVSTRRVQALITSGRLPAVKLARDWFIAEADLAALVIHPTGRPRKVTPSRTPRP